MMYTNTDFIGLLTKTLSLRTAFDGSIHALISAFFHIVNTKMKQPSERYFNYSNYLFIMVPPINSSRVGYPFLLGKLKAASFETVTMIEQIH
uniref:Uncharacterized protein n=1 Tax=Anguilla anguilla TaxID=7936 RepID=A0A0E9QGV0_ANGAN